MATRFNPAVSALLDATKHPLRKEIDELRTIILGVDKSIEEGVKWNAASFRTVDWFATLNGPKQVKKPMLILHAGAKAKNIVLKDRIADPGGLIKWLGKDRAQVTFADRAGIKENQEALRKVLKSWIATIQ